ARRGADPTGSTLLSSSLISFTAGRRTPLVYSNVLAALELRRLFDLHDFYGAAVFQSDAIAQLRCEKRFAQGRNPTHRVRLEIEFVNTHKGVSLRLVVRVSQSHGCAERNVFG